MVTIPKQQVSEQFDWGEGEWPSGWWEEEEGKERLSKTHLPGVQKQKCSQNAQRNRRHPLKVVSWKFYCVFSNLWAINVQRLDKYFGE